MEVPIIAGLLVQLIMKNYANWLDVKGTRQSVFPSAHRNAGRR